MIEREEVDLRPLALADKKKDEFIIEALRENFWLSARVELLEKDNEELRNENSELGINKIKASYEERIKILQIELEETKRKLDMRNRVIDIESKEVL